MRSAIAVRLKLRYSPVGILFSDEKPEQALEFAERKWGCAGAMLTAAARGKTAVFSRKTFGCLGGGTGLGLGNFYGRFPGGIAKFLSVGAGEGYPTGEAYKKTPELAEHFVGNLLVTDIAEQYVMFKEMESNLDGSFFDKPAWAKVEQRL